MNEPTIHIQVIDPTDQQRQQAREAYLDWLQRTESDLKEHAAKFIPLKPRITRENLYNL